MSIRDKFNLDGKVAIVTGASKGIGEAMARGLAEAGASVVVSSRKQEAVAEVMQSFRDAGLEAIAVACHMGHVEEIENLVEKTLETYGGIDIIVNNAATSPVYGPTLNTELRAFDKIIEINLRGPFFLCKLVYPSMKERGGGTIINVSSTAGIEPDDGLGIYSMSKAALINLTKSLARDLGKDGIRVHAVCPGLIKTRFSEALWQNEAILSRVTEATPLRRIGMPEDLAAIAVFLASAASAYITGNVHIVDGGLVNY